MKRKKRERKEKEKKESEKRRDFALVERGALFCGDDDVWAKL